MWRYSANHRRANHASSKLDDTLTLKKTKKTKQQQQPPPSKTKQNKTVKYLLHTITTAPWNHL